MIDTDRWPAPARARAVVMNCLRGGPAKAESVLAYGIEEYGLRRAHLEQAASGIGVTRDGIWWELPGNLLAIWWSPARLASRNAGDRAHG
jgi:hypothetical protein